MADDKKVSLWISLKDGVSAGLEKIKTGWEKSMAAMQKSALMFVAGFAGTMAGIWTAINAYKEQESAIAALEAAMRNAGTYTKEASKDQQAYAAELQKTTAFADEQINMAQASIATFGFQGQTLKDLTKVTLDLAAAKGMDLGSAADLVAKSVGSETNALARYGITIEGTAGSTDRAAQAVANISALFGGRAAAAAQTFEGRMTQVKNQVGDVLENIGEPFADALTVILGKISEVTAIIAPWITKNAQLVAIIASVVAGITGLIAVLAGIVTIAPVVGAAITVMTGPIGIIITSLAVAAGAVTYFLTSNSSLAQGVRAAWNTIGTVFSSYAEAIKETFGNLGEYLKGFGTVLAGVLTGNIGNIKTGISEMKSAVLDSGSAFTTATNEIVAAFDKQLAAEKNALEQSAAIQEENLTKKSEQKQAAFEMDQELDEIRKEYEAELAAEKTEFERATYEERLAMLEDTLGRERIAKDAARMQEAIDANKHNEAQKIQNQLYADAMVKIHTDRMDKEKSARANNLQDLISTNLKALLNESATEDQKQMLAEGTRDFIGNLKSLMRSDNKTMFEVGKRAAQAEALVNTYLSATKAYASLAGIPIIGPVAGGIAAAAAVTAGLMNVHMIEKQQFQAAGGAYAPGDGATVRMGERGNPEWIMNQGNIRELINEASGSGNVVVRVYIAGSEIRPAIVEIEKEKSRMQEAGIL